MPYNSKPGARKYGNNPNKPDAPTAFKMKSSPAKFLNFNFGSGSQDNSRTKVKNKTKTTGNKRFSLFGGGNKYKV